MVQTKYEAYGTLSAQLPLTATGTFPEPLEKMVLWGKQCIWKPSPTIAHKIYDRCFIYPKHNPGKPLHGSQGHFPLPKGPFEVWQLDFIQVPSSQGYKYILVMVCLFSHWVEAFPCRRAMTLTVGKLLLERIIPVWGIPLSGIVTRVPILLDRSLNLLERFGQ